MGMIAYLLTSYGNVKFLKCALARLAHEHLAATLVQRRNGAAEVVL